MTSWAKNRGYQYVVVSVSPEMGAALSRSVEQFGTKIEFYQAALRGFINHYFYGLSRKKGHQIVYMATYKNPNRVKVRMWIEQDIFRLVSGLAREENVSVRAFCYTALAFNLNREK